MATIIKSTGERIEDNRRFLTLEEAQKIAGGWVQVVNMNNNQIMIVNEEGKLLGLPFNAEATRIICEALDCVEIIVGDVILCDNLQFK